MPARKKDFTPEESEALRRLGARIKALRVAAGYANYEKFANDKNIGRTQYGRYEKGENLRYLSLVNIARLFDMTVGELLAGVEEA